MKYLVARTTTFRDRTPWGEGVDLVDELREVESHRSQRWRTLALGVKLAWKSRGYDGVAVGRFGVWLPILLRLLGSAKPVVMTDVEWRGDGSGRLDHWAGNAATAVCCNTREEMERYSKHFSIPLDKFRLLLMAYQDADMRPASDEGYVFAGGNQGRDWETFMAAVEHIPFPVRCFTSRPIPVRIPPNVIIDAVSRAEFYDRMAAASCVVVPVRQEALRVTGTTTWINAMGMGKVVIATEPYGAPDYMEEGVSGFFVEHGDITGLRERILRVMMDAGLRQRVGAAARSRALAEFSPAAFRRNVLSILGGRENNPPLQDGRRSTPA